MEIPANQNIAGCSANAGVTVTMEYRGKFIGSLLEKTLHGYKKITIDDADDKLNQLRRAEKPHDMIGCYGWKRLKGNEWRDCFQIRIKPNNGKIRMRYKWKKGAKQP